MKSLWHLGASLALAAMLIAPSAPAFAENHTKILTVYAAGTLAVPFRQVDAAFEKLHPGVEVHPEFGGSVMMARRISDLHQHADVYASADYAVIPAVLGKARLASWFIGFASNAVTLAYTSQSRGAKEINSKNWYRVVAEPGVVIGRSDPNTDPSGYQFLQMLSLASAYYKEPELESAVLKNAPRDAMRDTETSLISALQLGQIDYLAIYSSSAKAHHLQYVQLPVDINLSDPSRAPLYAHGRAKTDKGMLNGKPIIYAVTIPSTADNAELAAEYIHFLIGAQGRSLLARTSLAPLDHPLLHGASSVPTLLESGTRPWPTELAVGGN
ncbi:MAG: extracellular solute-binding protein [Gammaproteobacteria bacterium]